MEFLHAPGLTALAARVLSEMQRETPTAVATAVRPF